MSNTKQKTAGGYTGIWLALGLIGIGLLWLFSLPANAAPAITAGGARDFIKIGGEWEEFTSPLAGVAYDVVLADDGSTGLSFGARYSQDQALISEYAIDYWSVGAALEWFVRAKVDLLERDLVGEFKLLGGGGAGVRFEALGVPLEFSGHYAGGSGIQHSGLFFGPRIALDNP